MSFLYTLNYLVRNFNCLGALFWISHVVFNPPKSNQRLWVQIFNKQLLADAEASFYCGLTIIQDQNIFRKSQRFVQGLEKPTVVEKRVSTLSCDGLKEENDCRFWSATSKNLSYFSFTTSADLPEILLIETNVWRVIPMWFWQ